MLEMRPSALCFRRQVRLEFLHAPLEQRVDYCHRYLHHCRGCFWMVLQPARLKGLCGQGLRADSRLQRLPLPRRISSHGRRHHRHRAIHQVCVDVCGEQCERDAEQSGDGSLQSRAVLLVVHGRMPKVCQQERVHPDCHPWPELLQCCSGGVLPDHAQCCALRGPRLLWVGHAIDWSGNHRGCDRFHRVCASGVVGPDYLSYRADGVVCSLCLHRRMLLHEHLRPICGHYVAVRDRQ
mmetsp:Transcript_113961/g.295127  ORF Transcript_113961/g.295127 Transcript_113961/m.295127 type:complete len:237 (-) Transcript_113961:205-915(-)